MTRYHASPEVRNELTSLAVVSLKVAERATGGAPCLTKEALRDMVRLAGSGYPVGARLNDSSG
jgi:hypothetical protein